MYVATMELKYEIIAVGTTEKECKANLVKAFKQYMKAYKTTLTEWLTELNVNYSDYHRDLYTFLHEYYGVHMFDVTKGYALGWE
jgi:hypothetical protein